MEEVIIMLFFWMGVISAYLVTATAVGGFIYSRLSNADEEGRLFLSIFGGALFPVAIPIGLVILWVKAMINIPIPKGETEPSEAEQNGEKKEKKAPKPKKEVEPVEPDVPFKVGDLVTGGEGNPGNYEILYPGCMCRVLEVDEDDEDMKVMLVGHVDKEAHEERIGMIRAVPWENFTLIKQPRKKAKKKVAKKKVSKKKK